VATTRSRPRGREQARPSTGGTTAEHAAKIYTAAIIGIVVIVAFLALTSVGHVIDAATQHFMLFYAGVFALIGLCASVVLGLVSTDRVFLNPGHRVLVQSAHRAASFGAVTFLVIHILTEILAQRAHALDAVVPFLSPFRTFYIGLGTIASDLIILLVITGIMRGRFNANGKAWRWRAIHYASYASFLFGVWHGLLGGRPGKPYVDWSYGFLVAFVLLGLAVRVLSNSLRPKENLSSPPVDMAASSASAPMRAAAMFAQLGISRGRQEGGYGVLRAATGGQPVMSAPLSAPVLTALPAGPEPVGQGQLFYEPGYEGPPRYLGAPRATDSGPMPRAGTGPIPRAGTGPMPRAGTGPFPRAGTGPLPRAATGPLPMARTGPFPQAGTGQLPPASSGPMRRADSGPMPRAATGPLPRAATGPMPMTGTGPMPRAASGPIPRVPTGPIPLAQSGPMPRVPAGPIPRPPTGPMPRTPTGPMPRSRTGPMPRAGTGPMPRTPTGPLPRAGTGSFPSVPLSGDAGRPRVGPPTGPWPRPETGPLPVAPADDRRIPDSWNLTSPDVRSQSRGAREWDSPGWDDYPAEPRHPRHATGPIPRAEDSMPLWARPGAFGGEPGHGSVPITPAPVSQWDAGWHPAEPSWEGGLPEPDPGLKYREPGPGMPGYRGSRDHRYGGDQY
jgi:DMSO/TMAO reductase YedYZ heme-binding membrane subunit